MSTIINLKTALMKPLIRFIIRRPQMMESKLFLKAMQVFPEKISRSYDEKVKGSALEYEAALTGGLDLIEREPLRILDLCTGTGSAAFMALKRFSKATVIGVDQSQGMITAAEQKVTDSDRERISFHLGNAAELDFEKEAFDLIITSNAPVYIEEAVRVLRSGGDLLITYSFGGEAFLKAEKEIRFLMRENGLHLRRLETAGEGVIIYGQKA